MVLWVIFFKEAEIQCLLGAETRPVLGGFASRVDLGEWEV